MMIVDAQIHLWAKGTPSAHHRQTPYLKEEALAAMDAAGVDRAVIHPVMWDPDSNELPSKRHAPIPIASPSWVGSTWIRQISALRSKPGKAGPG